MHVVDIEALELWLPLPWIYSLQVLFELATLQEPLAYARLGLILMVVTDCQDCEKSTCFFSTQESLLAVVLFSGDAVPFFLTTKLSLFLVPE